MASPLINLSGKKGLVVGIANHKSIALGCARAFRAAGAELVATYLNEKAEKYVRPLAEDLECALILPLDVQQPGQMENVFEKINATWGRLDFLLHAIAYAPKDDLHGRVTDASLAGFLQAMDVSCHSFMRMAKLAEPLMKQGGSLLTLTYYASQKVMPPYGIMGPVKAALESAVKYMAAELGRGNIRVNALSPGLVATRAASGIAHFEEMFARAAHKTPLHQLANIDDIGNFAAFLVSDAAKTITGGIHYADAGHHAVDWIAPLER